MPSSFVRLVFLSLLFVLFALSINSHADEKKSSAPQTYTSVVRHVVDGDSLYLVGVQRQIRLWGVDAPELKKPGYFAARNALMQKVKGKRLRCVTQDHDRYGRIVARCFMPATKSRPVLDVNEWMLKSGTAKEYCYFTKGYYGYCD
jgi:micrococcal nuclease